MLTLKGSQVAASQCSFSWAISMKGHLESVMADDIGNGDRQLQRKRWQRSLPLVVGTAGGAVVMVAIFIK